MFELAFAIGIFSYIIFFLGILGWLYQPLVIMLTILYWGGFVWLRRTNIFSVILDLIRDPEEILKGAVNVMDWLPTFAEMTRRKMLRHKLLVIILALLLLQMFINLIGVFGPEISFDATWYHLTLPKLFLMWHKIQHIPGGLLYYSDMPKLTEMLYVPGLVFVQTTGPKFIHFLFGILCCIALFKFGRKFFSPFLSLIAVTIFYSNLVVGWESISAYIDLARTLFAILSFFAFVSWFETKHGKWLIVSALCVGLGIATKFLVFMDLGIFIPLIIYIDWKKQSVLFSHLLLFVLITLLVPLPWWIYSYLQTGNPFYPFFTSIYPTVSSLNINPLGIVTTVWNAFTHSADPISPLYIALLPFIFFIKKWNKKLMLLTGIGGFSIIIWYISPQTGGGRFLLPYLPVLSLLVVIVFQNFKSKYLRRLFVICLLLNLFISIGYRAVANAKFIPVILAKETKAQFLTKYLNFSFGDWYDIDGYMTTHIKTTDTVLLYGYHNLYYVDFPYIHESWVKKGDTFDYIATDGKGLPPRFEDWKLVYQNPITHLHLYTNGGKVWSY